MTDRSTSAAATLTKIDHNEMSPPPPPTDKFIQLLGDRYGRIRNKRTRRKLELEFLHSLGKAEEEEEEEESEQFYWMQIIQIKILQFSWIQLVSFF